MALSSPADGLGDAPGPVTRVLERLAAGDASAHDELFGLVHTELRGLADRAIRGMRAQQTLQATALVHEVWIRLAGPDAQTPRNRRHFLGVAAKAMRSVLVDHARREGRLKRGGGRPRVGLSSEIVDAYAERALDLIELDDALERLALEEPRLAQIVELRFFAGLTIAQTAEVLELGTSTVERDWRLARVWLRREMGSA